VPEGANGPIGQTVVVAYDGSKAAKRAIASFAASGLATSRNVHVATVDDSGAQAYELASAGATLLADVGVAATPHSVVSALSSVEALFAFAGELRAGLVVMGAFAHSRLAHLFHGSVTRGLVERTSIPLYLQH
jgi:nucleotide-binding universal stress UspA family protein